MMDIRFDIKENSPMVVMFEGSPLHMNGEKIGRIKKVTCTEKGMFVTVKIYKKFEKQVRDKL